MSAGDEQDVPATLVGGEYRDQEVDVTVKVTVGQGAGAARARRRVRAERLEFDTVDELASDVLERVTRAARLEQAAAARDAVLEKLLTLRRGAAARRSRRGREDQPAPRPWPSSSSYAGMTRGRLPRVRGADRPRSSPTQLDKRVRDAMAAQFVLEEIADVEEMGVEEDELTQLLMRRAQQSGISPEQYIKHAVEHNHLPEIVE